jgi:hypothetical protein
MKLKQNAKHKHACIKDKLTTLVDALVVRDIRAIAGHLHIVGIISHHIRRK